MRELERNNCLYWAGFLFVFIGIATGIASYVTVAIPMKADIKTSKIGQLFFSISLINMFLDYEPNTIHKSIAQS